MDSVFSMVGPHWEGAVRAPRGSAAPRDGAAEDQGTDDDEHDRPQGHRAGHLRAAELHQADKRQDAAGDERPPVVLGKFMKAKPTMRGIQRPMSGTT